MQHRTAVSPDIDAAKALYPPMSNLIGDYRKQSCYHQPFDEERRSEPAGHNGCCAPM